MFDDLQNMLKKAIESAKAEEQKILSVMTPQEKAQYNRYKQREKKIVNDNSLTWQEKLEKIQELASGYGVKRS